MLKTVLCESADFEEQAESWIINPKNSNKTSLFIKS
jgi:hypothetical protein